MTSCKRISAVGSLAAYLLASTALHALHDHSAPEHSWGDCNCDSAACCLDDECACHCGEADEASAVVAPSADPSPCPPVGAKHICFACRLLAVKSIAPVAVVVAEQSDVVRQAQPQPQTFVAVLRPLLPVSRGPPCA
jgi:hypothetical protein